MFKVLDFQGQICLEARAAGGSEVLVRHNLGNIIIIILCYHNFKACIYVAICIF